MTVDVELKIVNATALDPGKVYLLEFDREKVSSVQVKRLLDYFRERGIHGAAIGTHGGDGLRVVETRSGTPGEDITQ